MIIKTFLAITIGISLLVLAVPITKMFVQKRYTQEVEQLYKEDKIPKVENKLITSRAKVFDVKKILTLKASNTIVFRGPVTESSVSDIMRKMTLMSRRLSRNIPIYLVIDSPGGSVFDGLDFIQFAKALPQRVRTVTLFAASMGFMIVQNLDKRYIATNGTLMSHRASVTGLSGQINGELESRYKMIKRAVDYLEYKSSKRMKLSLDKYRTLINPEYWVHGFDAVGDSAADEQVLIRCDSSLDGEEALVFRTFFGPVKAYFSKCPLIKAPIKMEFKRVRKSRRKYLKYVFMLVFENKRKFVEDFIVKDNINRFNKIFPSN